MSGFAAAGFGAVLKWWSNRGPTREAQATGKAAAAQTNLATSETANAELEAAAAARAAADAQRVRNDPHAGDVTLDPSAGINLSPDNHFRD